MTAQPLLAIPGTTHLSSTAKGYSWSQTSSIKRTKTYFLVRSKLASLVSKDVKFPPKRVFGRKFLISRKTFCLELKRKGSRQPTTSSSSVIRFDFKSIFDVWVVGKKNRQNWFPRIRKKPSQAMRFSLSSLTAIPSNFTELIWTPTALQRDAPGSFFLSSMLHPLR